MSTVHLEPMYSRHETFPPRFGWFKKMYGGILKDQEVFSRDDATLTLGVGKNMVRAIRFWSGAADLVVPRRAARNEQLAPTDFARVVFADDGWDPYLELPATIWLLHWRFFAPGCQLPVWWYAFHDYTHLDFTVAGLAADATRAIPVLYNLKEPSENSVRRDVECLVHTYTRRPDGRMTPEDAFACPFRVLGLIEADSGHSGGYRFRMGTKPGLPGAVVLFAALDFTARWNRAARSISLAGC